MVSMGHRQPSRWLPDARAQAILAAIVREHIATGEPVGSRTVSERCAGEARWSPATIRNVMAELEEAGFVEQPHTSAGRIPTDKGYRFYVDHMISEARLPKGDRLAIRRAITRLQDEEDPERLMERVSHLLSELTNNVGIAFSPPMADNRLQHVEFVKLADERALVVLVFAPNIIQHRLIRLDEPMAQEELDRAARYLNAEFKGRSLVAIRAELMRRLREEEALYNKLLRQVALLCERSFAEAEKERGEVYVDGASNILTKPDFSDLETLRELLRTLEERSRLVRIINECLARDPCANAVQIMIGRENLAPALRNCSMITAPYRIADGSFGALGVVGPMRIEYERVIALVNHVARILEQKFSAASVAV